MVIVSPSKHLRHYAKKKNSKTMGRNCNSLIKITKMATEGLRESEVILNASVNQVLAATPAHTRAKLCK